MASSLPYSRARAARLSFPRVRDVASTHASGSCHLREHGRLFCVRGKSEWTSCGRVGAACAWQVMVAGGYVVLERPNPALVAAVSARVYSVVAPLADPTPGAASQTEVEVISPQMGQSRRYTVACGGDSCSVS